MTWLHAFELICYLIVAMLLVHLVRMRSTRELFCFGAAALVGFVMELLAVSVTDIYTYNPSFWLSIGIAPKQFPVFGGLMWGGLTVMAIRLAKRLQLPRLQTALATGIFIVSMDILLDVVAIRLDGGFWTWEGRPINLDIDQHMFMSVIWINFLGYLIETPTVCFLTLRAENRIDQKDLSGQTRTALVTALVAILVTAAGSGIALGLNWLTDDWFACIAFVSLWLTITARIVTRAHELRLRPCRPTPATATEALFWIMLYAYCLAALAHLGIAKARPTLLVAGLVFAGFTTWLSLTPPTE